VVEQLPPAIWQVAALAGCIVPFETFFTDKTVKERARTTAIINNNLR
jgi:hypothetical protein